jgi:O-methyltransferase
VVIKKGYFPETAKGLEDEKFAFVRIDVNLYKPIFEGLEFFYPKLEKGGYIFVHDYNHSGWPGTTKAVKDFSKKYDVPYFPLSDSGGSAIFMK